MDYQRFPRPEFERRVRLYTLMEAEGIQQDAVLRIGAMPDAARRKDCHAALERLREQLSCMDLSGLGWPPRGGLDDGEDVLHADSQKLASAVVRFDHRLCQIQILYYALKERP